MTHEKLKKSKCLPHSKWQIILFVILVALLPLGTLSAQVSGRVIDEMGDALPGVSVMIKGENYGTITDYDGNYHLPQAQGTSILRFNFMGMLSQDVSIDNRSVINVTMKEDVVALQDVVVVGYGTQKRANVTAAIVSLDTTSLKYAARSNAATALQGTIPGLRVVNTTGSPGASPNIILRGGASISKQTGPLYIVDGIVRTDISDLNSNDIQSMDVLKDAASAAIYGARSNNGVILITTKKGAAGQASITYSGKVGVNNQRRGKLQPTNSADYIYWNRIGQQNVDNIPTGSPTNYRGTLLTANGIGPDTQYPEVWNISWNKETLEALNVGNVQEVIDPVTNKPIYFIDHAGKNMDAAYNLRPITQDHNIDISGGNAQGKFRASLGYYSEEGLIVATRNKYERFTGSLYGSYNIHKNLMVHGNVNMSRSVSPNSHFSDMNLFFRTMWLWPTFNPYLPDGSPSPGVSSSDGNPLFWVNNYIRSNSTNRTSGIVGAEWKILPELVFRATANLYTYEYHFDYFTKSHTLINNPTPNTIRTQQSKSTNDIQQQYNATLSYTKAFARKHNLDAMAGVEWFQYDQFTSDMVGRGAPTDLIPTMNVAKEITKAETFRQGYRLFSSFARVNYDYANRYLLSLVGRYDGTSQLINNKFGFFPGVSLGWKMHMEDFMQVLHPYVSTLKPRVSYGSNGNISNIGYYSAQGRYQFLSTTYNNNIGIQFNTLATPDLKWEESTTINPGLDIGILSNRIMLTADYYNRITSNLQAASKLPSYTGFLSYVTNLGTFQNQGLELALKANIIQAKKEGDFSWNLGINASYNVNKILKLPDNGIENNRQGGQLVADGKGGYHWVAPHGSYMEGGTLGEIYAYKQEKIVSTDEDMQAIANRYDAVAEAYGQDSYAALANKDGKKQITKGDVFWKDVDKNDTIDTRDMVRMGNIFPKWTGGISTTLNYKGISLYVFADFATNYILYNNLLVRTYGQVQGTFNIPEQVKDSWTPENPNTMWPKFYYADQLGMYNIVRGNSIFYTNTSYLCLRELTLSYDFPKRLVKKLYMQNLMIYGTAQNLAYLTNYIGSSPEPSVNNDGNDDGRYPMPRSFLAGIKITF